MIQTTFITYMSSKKEAAFGLSQRGVMYLANSNS